MKKIFKEPLVRILLLEGVNEIYISGTGPYKVKSLNKSTKFYAYNTIKIQTVSNGLVLSHKDKRANTSFPLYIEPEQGYILVNNKRYRGRIIIDKGPRVINEVFLEEYLLSVVPAEIGASSPSLLESAKAQAVCARSYALKKFFERNNFPFHLYSTTLDQVYLGRDYESAWSDVSIQLTRGIVLMHNRDIASALYHSTCGGRTADFREVFPSKKEIDYLRSVKCNIQGKDLCRFSPNYEWKREYEEKKFLSIISTNLSKMLGVHIPFYEIKNIQISERTRTGRVKEIKIRVGNETKIISGYDIRALFNDGKWGLPSTMFWIHKRGNIYSIKGKGFGHGVGLCQYGARELSKAGWTYEKILHFYFPGTKIKKIY